MDAFQHLKNTGKSSNKYKNIDVVINSNDKGLRMMNFVHDLQVHKKGNEDQIFVRACCWASYKRDRKYKVKLIVQKSASEKIKFASCDQQCPASKSQCCCHVMAVIWKLEDMTRKGELKDQSKKPSCTSKPQQWGKGGKREVQFHPVMAASIQKLRHSSDVPGERKRGVHSQFFDPRPLKSRKIDTDAIIKLRNDLKEINPDMPFANLLPDNVEIPTINTLIGPVARGSVLHKQLQGFGVPQVNFSDFFQIPLFQSVSGTTNQAGDTAEPSVTTSSVVLDNILPLGDSSPTQQHESTRTTPENDFPQLPNKCLEEQVDLTLFNNGPGILNQITVSLKSAQELQCKTIGQASNDNWKRERQYRITASKFGKIVSRKKEPTPEFIKSVCDPPDLSYLPCIQYGRENEENVAHFYMEKMNSGENTGSVIKEVGLCVNPSLPHLGASLDRSVLDPKSENKFGALEIKTCPKAGSLGLSMKETVGHPLFKSDHFLHLKEDRIILNPKHSYSYQVQGQLALSNLHWADFVAYSGVGELFIQRILFDQDLWLDFMLPKLNAFYFALNFYATNTPTRV